MAVEKGRSIPPLPDGHTARFARKLEKSKTRRQRHNIRIGLAAFAAAAPLLVAVFLWQGGNAENAPISTIAMVRGYYASLIWEESEFIEQITEDMDEVERNHLLAEIDYLKHDADSIAETIMNGPYEEDMKIHYMIVVYSSHQKSLKRLSAYYQSRLSDGNEDVPRNFLN